MNARNAIYVRSTRNWTALREGKADVKSGRVREVSFPPSNPPVHKLLIQVVLKC